MIKTFILLTALGLTQGAQRSLTVSHPDCPATGHALLPHEYDCTKFYYCEGGQMFVAARDCPPNTEFSATQQVCIHPEQANCQLPGYPAQEASTSAPETNDTACPCEFLENGCPADFSIHLLLPHETSCRKFYYCVNGQKILSQCNRGSVFDPDIQNCAAAGSIDRTCEDEDSSSEEDPGTEESQSSEEVELLPNGCPADWSVFMYLPHDHYCNKYYQCVDGELVERRCASGTHFNPETQRCDHPSIVNCTLPGGDASSEEVEIPEAPETTTSPPMDLLDNGCPVDGSIVWMVPHEEDCGQFYHCVWGNLILGTCPNGLHFSPALQRCESPAIAGCSCTGGCFEDLTVESSSEEDMPVGNDPNDCGAGNDCNNDNDDNQCTGNDCDNISSSEEDLPIGNDPNDCGTGNDCNNDSDDNQCTGNDCGNISSSEEDLPVGNDPNDCGVGNDCNPNPSSEEDLPVGNDPNECTGNECDNECSGNNCNSGSSSEEDLPVGNDPNDCGTDNDCNNECSGTDCNPASSSEEDLPVGNDPNECTDNDCDNECAGNDCSNESSSEENLPVGNDPNDCGAGNDCNNDCSDNDCNNECTGNDCSLESSSEEDLPVGNDPNECSGNDCSNASSNEEDLPIGNDPNECTGNDCDNGCSGNDCDNECSGNDCNNISSSEEDLPVGNDPNDCGAGNDCSNECSGNDCNNVSSSEEDLPVGNDPNDCGTDNDCDNNDSGCTGDNCDNECSGKDCNNTSSSEEDLPIGNDPNDCGTGNDCDSNDSGCTGNDCDNECNGNQCNDDANEPDCPAPVDPQQKCEDECNVLPWAHEDCDKYWQCDGKQPLLVVCSEGLHFNPVTHTCDFACNVGCVRETIQTTAGDDGIRIYIPWSLHSKTGDLLKLFNV